MRRSPICYKFIIACFLVMFWIGNGMCGNGFDNPVLNWKIGDHWTVQTWLANVQRSNRINIFIHKGKPIFVQFEVGGIITSRYGECYVVNAVYPKDPAGFQFSYNLHYSCKDGRLLSVIENSTLSDGTKIDTHYNFTPETNVPTLTKRVHSNIPFDQPLFSEAGTNLFVQEEGREIRQQIVPDADGKGFTTEISVKYINGEERRIEQKWEPEVPWWTELKEYKNDELIYEQEFILDAQVRLKPEALEVSPGILTAFVRLPEGYPASGITSATCDGASAEKMMLNDDQTEIIIKFRRKDIEAALAQVGQSLDTTFVVRGTWQGASGTSVPFQGTASIKKIVGEKEKKK